MPLENMEAEYLRQAQALIDSHKQRGKRFATISEKTGGISFTDTEIFGSIPIDDLSIQEHIIKSLKMGFEFKDL